MEISISIVYTWYMPYIYSCSTYTWNIHGIYRLYTSSGFQLYWKGCWPGWPGTGFGIRREYDATTSRSQVFALMLELHSGYCYLPVNQCQNILIIWNRGRRWTAARALRLAQCRSRRTKYQGDNKKSLWIMNSITRRYVPQQSSTRRYDTIA